ncbi:MAG: glycoside hydrolase family 2 protein [Spirochaetes bacterium]|nr:glycoside hydrolase family 2 protein [Spirochaetota bacterium]
MSKYRTTRPLLEGWKLCTGEPPMEALAWGNHDFTAGEIRIWQKAENHGLSKPENPHTDGWRTVGIPHDFVIEGAFTDKAPLNNGSLAGGKAYYVNKFELPPDAGQRIHLEFDGVYRDCTVHVNGHFIGRHLSGYTSFGFDITEVCRFGAMNAVCVHVNATENELWSYEGGGIYRDVKLITTAQVFVPQWGVCVRTGDESAVGNTGVMVSIRNASCSTIRCDAVCSIVDADGKTVAVSRKETVDITALDDVDVALHASVQKPVLWNVDAPVLYRVVVEISVDGDLVDCYEQPFGYRTFRFDPATGFYLNGVNMKLKGVCCHQDHSGVGVAVPPALQEWRVRRLKDLGANAIRTSHNQPDPALLDACDRLGMLVMDEIRMPGIGDELTSQFKDTLRRDRNHPAVILWSLGNEEMGIQHKSSGIKIFRRLQELSHKLDPTRPTTYAMNCDWINISKYHDDNGFRFDVFGANYRSDQKSARYDEFHQRHPDWPMLGSETWGGTCTRGLYEPDTSTIPVTINPRRMNDADLWADEAQSGYVSAYQNYHTPWGYSIEECWQDCANRPYMAGTFLWTGFDYRGETSPYLWPAVITRYGILDLCGFYKEAAHYLRAWWRPDDPHLFLMPHWNWEGYEGKAIDVWCYSNAASVELFLNGRSLGKKTMPVNDKLTWQVPWEQGTLEAKGYDSAGTIIANAVRRTAKAPEKVILSSGRTTCRADGRDIIVIDASIVDASGEVCPRAQNEVVFNVEGPAEILGVGNGNPMSHEPDKGTNRRKAFHGLCQVILQSTGAAGAITVCAESRRIETGVIMCDAQ